MSELYDAEEIKRLTGASRATAQGAWLKEQAIPHKVDGRRVIVSREHVRAWLEGRPVRVTKGPNWAALENA